MSHRYLAVFEDDPTLTMAEIHAKAKQSARNLGHVPTDELYITRDVLLDGVSIVIAEVHLKRATIQPPVIPTDLLDRTTSV